MSSYAYTLALPYTSYDLPPLLQLYTTLTSHTSAGHKANITIWSDSMHALIYYQIQARDDFIDRSSVFPV